MALLREAGGSDLIPLVSDPDFTLYVGDVRDVLAELPDESVHMVCTSPPYWGLRDYGTSEWEGGDAECEHRIGRVMGNANKGHVRDVLDGDREHCKCGATRVDRQLGLEATPEEYVANMVEVFREVRRTLRVDDNYQPGTVLDIFLGSGTTALVARRHGRRCIGIELSPSYAALAAKRLSQLSLLADA